MVLCVSMGLNAWLLNAASRNAMQLFPVAAPKATKATDTVDTEKTVPKVSVTVAATKPVFQIEDSESDDDEKHINAIKKTTRRVRSASECMQILSDGRPQELLDEEVIALTIQKKIPLYALEKTLKDLERAVKIRRAAVCMFFIG